MAAGVAPAEASRASPRSSHFSVRRGAAPSGASSRAGGAGRAGTRRDSKPELPPSAERPTPPPFVACHGAFFLVTHAAGAVGLVRRPSHVRHSTEGTRKRLRQWCRRRAGGAARLRRRSDVLRRTRAAARRGDGTGTRRRVGRGARRRRGERMRGAARERSRSAGSAARLDACDARGPAADAALELKAAARRRERVRLRGDDCARCARGWCGADRATPTAGRLRRQRVPFARLARAARHGARTRRRRAAVQDAVGARCAPGGAGRRRRGRRDCRHRCSTPESSSRSPPSSCSAGCARLTRRWGCGRRSSSSARGCACGICWWMRAIQTNK